MHYPKEMIHIHTIHITALCLHFHNFRVRTTTKGTTTTSETTTTIRSTSTSTSNVIKHVKKYPEPALDTSLFGNSEPEEKFRNAYYDLER